jgi:hypothetical protein
MIKVETADGVVLYINAKQVLMVGSVIEDGVPMLGRARVMLLGGIGLMVKADPQELSVTIGNNLDG